MAEDGLSSITPAGSLRLAANVGSVYALGECEIDLARRELRLHGSPVPGLHLHGVSEEIKTGIYDKFWLGRPQGWKRRVSRLRHRRLGEAVAYDHEPVATAQ
jgi:hypothetical protein